MKKLKIILPIFIALALLIYCNTNKADKYYNNTKQILSGSGPLADDLAKPFIHEGNKTSGEFQFSGGKLVYTIQSDEDKSVNVTYYLSNSTGSSKLVAITADKKIITLVENINPTTNQGNTTLNLPAGKNTIELICKDKAFGDFEVLVE